MSERIFPAKLDQLDNVLSFINEELDRNHCSSKVKFQMDVSAEEIFVNIAHYAYRPEQKGEATVCFCIEGDPLQVTIQFIDSGSPFNLLEKEDADITLSAEERSIGGLGILMVKKTMDTVDYQYVDGYNILTMKKIVREPLDE